MKISCKHVVATLRHGANSVATLGSEKTGTVYLKVYFDEAKKKFSITGVMGNKK